MSSNTNKRLELFKQRVPLYQKDPVLFAKEVCNFQPDDWQEKVFMDIAKKPRVSVRSGHGVGKTGTESILLLWFLTCFKFPKIIATAPTRQQLNDILWAEVCKWQSRSPLLQELLKWTKTYIYMKGYEKRWFAVAKTANKAEGMQGFHEDNLLFIVDEASGIDEEIMEAILGTLSGSNNKLLMCGNPTKTTGTFYDSHNKDRAMYACHKVSSMDSSRTNKANITAVLRKYGENSNFARVRVFGEFPAQEDDVFISLELIESATLTEIDITEHIHRITLGVDVARFGDDETVIIQNVGGNVALTNKYNGQNLMWTVGSIVNAYKALIRDYPQYKGVITAYIDDTGMGGGVTDRLNEVKSEENLNRLEIVPVNFASAPPQDGSEIKYDDITSYMWGTIRDMLQNKELCIPNDDDLIGQLSVRKYAITSKGKIKLETKKAMKDRKIKSPDIADALGLSCYTTNKVYNEFIEKEELVLITLNSVLSLNIMKISIGISVGSSVTGASFVATAITEGYKRVVVLASAHYAGKIETEAVEKLFKEFALLIIKKYNKMPSVVYVDDKAVTINRAIKNVVAAERLNSQVRFTSNADEIERIRITTRLMSQNRLFITEDCSTLSKAFNSATWNNKRTNDSRSDASDITTLKAFEYTIERDASRFITVEQ